MGLTSPALLSSFFLSAPCSPRKKRDNPYRWRPTAAQMRTMVTYASIAKRSLEARLSLPCFKTSLSLKQIVARGVEVDEKHEKKKQNSNANKTTFPSSWVTCLGWKCSSPRWMAQGCRVMRKEGPTNSGCGLCLVQHLRTASFISALINLNGCHVDWVHVFFFVVLAHQHKAYRATLPVFCGSELNDYYVGWLWATRREHRFEQNNSTQNEDGAALRIHNNKNAPAQIRFRLFFSLSLVEITKPEEKMAAGKRESPKYLLQILEKSLDIGASIWFRCCCRCCSTGGTKKTVRLSIRKWEKQGNRKNEKLHQGFYISRMNQLQRWRRGFQ